MTARGKDVSTAGVADWRGETGVHHDLGKVVDRGVAAGFKGATGPGVEWDEVHLGGEARDEANEFAGVGLAVVDAFEHDVFEGDAAGVGGAGVAAAGGDQLGDRVFAVQWDQFVAEVIAHGMERDGEIDAELGAGAVHHGDDAGGGQRDAAARERDALVVHRDRHRLGHVGVIVERFAHAHQDDGGEQAWAFPHRAGPFVVGVARRHELADDLGGSEIACQALRAGVAEAAGESAADLGGDADGASVFLAVRDVDGLSLLSVAEAEQEFAGIVLAGLHDGGFRAGDDEVVRQLLLQRAGDGRHPGEVGLAAVVDPVPELLGAEGLLAEVSHLLGQFRAREADKVAATVGELYRRRIE